MLRSLKNHRPLGMCLALVLGLTGQLLWLQKGAPYGLLGCLFFLPALFLFLTSSRQEAGPSPGMSPQVEGVLFALIMILARALRVYHLGALPQGLYIDQGFVGWGALRILHEGWHPYGTMPIILTWPAVLYQCAAWFSLVKPTQTNLALFFVVLALLAFPLIYLFFRRLSDARTALLSLFLLAIMFWHLNACRNGWLSNQVYLYQFATLCLLLYGLKTAKSWAFAAASVFFTAGLYGYQSYKTFPLLIAFYIGYEFLAQPGFFRRYSLGLSLFGLVFLALSAPLAFDWFRHGFFTGRESWYFVGRAIGEQKSLRPLWDAVVRTALLFNRAGDPLPTGTTGELPMLDPVTGVLFLFGCFNALRSPFQRAHFYALAGLFTLSLPALLSVGPASHRIVGILPFVAYFSAEALVLFWNQAVMASKAWTRRALTALVAAALIAAGLYNCRLYWVGQEAESWEAHSLDATLVAKAVLQHPDTDFWVSPYFAQHYTLRYLTYFQQDRVHPMDIPSGLTPSLRSQRPGLCFALEKRKGGWLNLLRSLYPGGRVEEVRTPEGETLASLYYVPSGTVKAAEGKVKDGAFHGVFRADETGVYRFLFSGGMRVWLAHHPVAPGVPLGLTKGFYAFDLAAPRGSGDNPVSFKDPDGLEHPIGPEVLTTLPLDHGLLCRYSCSNPHLSLTRWDPVIDFMNTGDLPYATSTFFRAEWTGRLDCPVTGPYGLLLLTADEGMLFVDGKPVIDSGKDPEAGMVLKKGGHDLCLLLARDDNGNGVQMDYHFLWKKPGDPQYGAVPMSAFGETHP